MRSRRLILTLAMGLVLATAAGCKFSFTTANISSLKLSKDEQGTVETTTVAPGETLYAFAQVSNNPSKVKLKFTLFREDVEGQPKNSPVPEAERSFDVENDGSVRYYITLPAVWPAGKYRIEVAMLTEGGEQKDQKSTTFTVPGGSARTTPVSNPDTSQENAPGGSVKLTKLKLTSDAGSDVNAASESTFSPADHVYVVYTVENVPAGGQIACTVYAEDAEGAQPGETVRLLYYTNPTKSNFTESFNLDPGKSPGGAWGKGSYRIELTSRSGSDAAPQELTTAKFTIE